MRLEPWHFLILIVIALLLFGAPRLPGLARSMGQSLRIFKSEVKQMKDDDKDKAADSEAPPVQGRIVDGATPRTDASHTGDRTASGTTASGTTASGTTAGGTTTGERAPGSSATTENSATENSPTENSAAGPARSAGKPPSDIP